MSFLEEDVFTITWRIKNFSMCPVKADEFIESPVLLIRNFGNSEWKLRLHPKGFKYNDFILCYLCCASLGAYESPISIFLRLSFNTPLPFKQDTPTDITLNSSYGCPKLIAIEDVFREKDKYLPNDTLIIICRMKCKNQGGLPSTEKEIFETLSRESGSGILSIKMNECCIETIIPVQTKMSLWLIPRFHLLAAGKRIALPVFSAVKKSPSFYIRLFKDVESLVHMEIRRQTDNEGKNIFMRCSVSVLNTPKDFSYICAASDFLFKTDEVWKLPPLVLSEAKDYFEHTDNVLYLRFDFSISTEETLLHFERPFWGPTFLPPDDPIPPEALTAPTPDEEHPVVSFRVGDQTFKVLKSVLKARSEVFVAMFENDMKEKATGVVDIPDVDPQTWGRMVAFLYLGSQDADDLSSKDTRKLYAVSHKYQVQSLIDYSSYLLLNSMSVLNVCDILILADLHQDDWLLKSATHFVSLNSDRILTSQMWKNLMENNLSVAANVMHKLLVKGCTTFT